MEREHTGGDMSSLLLLPTSVQECRLISLMCVCVVVEVCLQNVTHAAQSVSYRFSRKKTQDNMYRTRAHWGRSIGSIACISTLERNYVIFSSIV